MSDTASAPPPAAGPQPAPAPLPSAPPPITQERLSISDAARLMRAQQRVQARQAAPANGQRAAPNGHAEAAQADAPQDAPQKATEAPAEPSGYDTIAKALGLPEAAQAPAEGQAEGQGQQSAGVELDGTRYSPEQLRTLVLQANDYTRKTQALAEQQRSMQGQMEALATVLPFIQPELAALSQRLKDVAPPDQSLIDTNPQEYMRQHRAYEDAQRDQARLGQIEALQRQAMERNMAAAVERGNAVLAEKYPFWKDPAQRDAVQRDIARWAIDKGGFTKAELAGLADPRQVEVLMRAMMFDRMVEGASGATTAPRAAAPARGTPPPPPPAEGVARAEQRFADAPNLRNAAALWSARRAQGA